MQCSCPHQPGSGLVAGLLRRPWGNPCMLLSQHLLAPLSPRGTLGTNLATFGNEVWLPVREGESRLGTEGSPPLPLTGKHVPCNGQAVNNRQIHTHKQPWLKQSIPGIRSSPVTN